MPATMHDHGGRHAGPTARLWTSRPTASVLACAACLCATASPAFADGVPAAIAPVFDCYAANSAWGLTYSGRVVDADGRVWSYRRHGKMLPAAVRENRQIWIGAADLAAKFAGATPAGQIDAKALSEHTALIDKASAGEIRRSDTGVRDAGTSSCHAYVHDAARARFRDVELGTDGGVSDVRIVNDAPEAKRLLDWLRSIGVAK